MHLHHWSFPRLGSRFPFFGILIFSALLVLSCDKAPPAPAADDSITIDLHGLVEKGPFIAGTAIMLSELDNRLDQTGRIYTTDIASDVGEFAFSRIKLYHQYIEIQADGYFYNEVNGVLSESGLNLTLLRRADENCPASVSVLSHLESDRIRTLYADGVPFDTAVARAHRELLAVFGIDRSSSQPSAPETLSIARAGNDNAILLAISSVLLGQSPVADFSEFLAHLRADFSDNGRIDDNTLLTRIKMNARTLDLPRIRRNLDARYAALGVSAVIPDFEHYVDSDGDGILNLNEMDDSPDTFAFRDTQNVDTGAILLCGPIVISGISDIGFTLGQAIGGSMEVNGSGIGGRWAELHNGDTVRIAVDAPDRFKATDTVQVQIGTLRDTFLMATSPMAIAYPDSMNYGKNLLNLHDSVFSASQSYSVGATLPSPDQYASLRVVVRRLTGTSATPNDFGWSIGVGNSVGWLAGSYDFATHTQSFSSIVETGTLVLSLYFNGEGTGVIECYEYGATTPVREKNIQWQ